MLYLIIYTIGIGLGNALGPLGTRDNSTSRDHHHIVRKEFFYLTIRTFHPALDGCWLQETGNLLQVVVFLGGQVRSDKRKRK